MFALWTGVFFVLLGFVVFSTHGSGDYNVQGIVGGDNAGPGLTALIHGSIHNYVDQQPIVGLTSILLRLPVMVVGAALGAGSFLDYQLGALVCSLPLAFLGAWMLTRPEFSRRQQVLTLIAFLIVIASPIVQDGITAGHPEGTLSKVLGTAAVLAAIRGRARWAAVFLGLAISAKESALIALPPVLIALPRSRREVLLIAGGLVFLLTGVVWLSDVDAFVRALHGEGATRYLTPFSPLWLFSSPVHLGDQLAVVRLMPWGLHRVSAAALTLALAMSVGTGWYVWARRRGATCDPLALLTLLGILRCVCDTTHEAYYATSILIPAATWESMRDRPPLITAAISFGNPIFFASLGRVSAGYLYGTSTAMAILLIGYVARHVADEHSRGGQPRAAATHPAAVDIRARKTGASRRAGLTPVGVGAVGRPDL